MKIVMIKNTKGAARSDGSVTLAFNVGEEYTADDWLVNLFQGFVNSGLANEFGGNQVVPETKQTIVKKGRSRKVES